ncbi:MAG: pitrilysin family protein [Anaerolineales bacterium]|jgi:zinc protease|nr:pitrilysin family protein [Anaerolineales bacterium]
MHSLPGRHDITRHTLPNGITVLARENMNSPSVVVDASIHAGSIYEGRSHAGLANFTAAMLMCGTSNASFEQIHERIESVGASLGSSCGVHTGGFSGKTLAEDLDMLLRTAADVVRNPIFPADHVERLRGETLTGLAMRAHNTRAMAAMTFYEALFGHDHPYGYSNDGYPDTVAAITRLQLKQFQRKHYGPQEMIVVIVGSVSAQAAIKLVEKHFGDWRNEQQPDRAPVPLKRKLNHGENRRVHIPGKTQTDIVLGFFGPRRSDTDFQAVRVANSILGVFGMYGRLGQRIRNKHGLAYYSFSRADGSFGPGTWRLIAGVNPEKVDTAIAAMLTEIDRLSARLVTPTELADSKSFILGSLPLQLETNEGVAGTLAAIELHGLGLDYLQLLPEQINSLTRVDIRSAAARLMDSNKYVLAVAGPE